MDQVSAFWFHMGGIYEAKPCPCKSFNFCGEIGSFYIICLDFMFHRLFCPSRLSSLFGTDPCWSSCLWIFVWHTSLFESSCYSIFKCNSFEHYIFVQHYAYNIMESIHRCMFCKSLFVLLYFFFWPLWWLFIVYLRFWLPLWYLQTLLTYFMIWISTFDIYVNFNKYRERKDIDIMRHKRVMLFNSHWAVYQL